MPSTRYTKIVLYVLGHVLYCTINCIQWDISCTIYTGTYLVLYILGHILNFD